ncbi:protein DEHYDRATION-INDUCED 19 homolog 4-like isoform X4 [Phalaenopsis equestris]|uniref:protein DEHYDRATION-INDUCED 19 homolog 4-like isoform X4 n=1 Tax=Phalaenopsis equestris TaxID=78828 RepID=UPI0009E55DFD|nr:protein DEHYDRATION-INDUCED 19 homolog 4-like isoform X4 [Phalaenopsis equestris]
MDSDLWISHLAAAKRHYSLQQQHSSHTDRFDVDEYELEEDARPDFPCPFCYEDHDITSLCSHLEDEHPFESKAAVCSICSVKVTGDMLSHIMLQHGQAFKLQRRRRLRRVVMPNSQALSLLGRDLREAHLQKLKKLQNLLYPMLMTLLEKNQQLQGLGTQALTFLLAKKKGKRSRGRPQSGQTLCGICYFQPYLMIS